MGKVAAGCSPSPVSSDRDRAWMLDPRGHPTHGRALDHRIAVTIA